MDYRTYQNIRGYCWQDLSAYIDTPFNNDMFKLKWRIDGEIANVEHELDVAKGLFHCKDLTPRERAAAHLLAVISNHRTIAWHREPVTPDGREPAEPLEPWQAAELWAQTRQAVTEYAAFIPEREAAMLLRLIPDSAPAQAATPAPVVAGSNGPASMTAVPVWSLITSLARTPGYRWPLYQFLQAAHIAGKPCPKAQDVLDAWKLNPPPGLRVVESGRRDALEYALNHGGPKTAELKSIQTAIDRLIVRITAE